MTAFDDRRKAFEGQYTLGFERLFKVQARRDRLLAQWVAALIGRTDVEAYVQEVVDAGLAAPGDEDVLTKILADFAMAGRDVDKAVVREKMHELMYEAAEQMERESARKV